MKPEEMTRLIPGLRKMEWSDRKITDFLLYIRTGDENYLPGRDKGRLQE